MASFFTEFPKFCPNCGGSLSDAKQDQVEIWRGGQQSLLCGHCLHALGFLIISARANYDINADGVHTTANTFYPSKNESDQKTSGILSIVVAPHVVISVNQVLTPLELACLRETYHRHEAGTEGSIYREYLTPDKAFVVACIDDNVLEIRTNYR
jgi:hypothetical protein